MYQEMYDIKIGKAKLSALQQKTKKNHKFRGRKN